MAPFISVVLIVFNDESRIQRALDSLSAQTFRDFEVLIIDDGSTDSSGHIARQWASQHQNATVVTLDTNSGNCGVPRNVGLEAAQGQYLAFLDSDDEYLPDAFQAMADEASEGPDILSFGIQRTSDTTGDTKRYNQRFSDHAGSFVPFVDRNDLFEDTIVPAKLIKRSLFEENNLRFPEGINYEDQLLSATLWTLAQSVVVGSEVVYDWHYGGEAERKSITSSRHEIQNFLDRIEINKKIDAVLSEKPELLHLKTRKLFKHDLGLYLRELVFREKGYQEELQRVASAYMQELSRDSYTALPPQHKLIYSAITNGTLEDLIESGRFVYQKGSSTASLSRSGAAFQWTVKGNSKPAAFNVTKFVKQLHDQQLLAPWHCYVSSCTAAEGSIKLTFSVLAFEGDKTSPMPKSAILELVERDSGTTTEVTAKKRLAFLSKSNEFSAIFPAADGIWDVWAVFGDTRLRLPVSTALIGNTPSFSTRYGRLTV